MYAEYLKHHKGFTHLSVITRPIRSDNLLDSAATEWDADFMNRHRGILIGLLNASHYLDIPPLTRLCAAKVATYIKGKTPDEVREAFGIVLTDKQRELEASIIPDTNKWVQPF